MRLRWFGHLLGDQLLQELAQVVVKNVRGCDIVARYGGEEFAVILPNCTREVAILIARRVRKAVEEYAFCTQTKGSGKITVSIGIAIYPDEQNKRQLLHKADKALYRAKQLGRNRVEIYENTTN